MRDVLPLSFIAYKKDDSEHETTRLLGECACLRAYLDARLYPRVLTLCPNRILGFPCICLAQQGTSGVLNAGSLDQEGSPRSGLIYTFMGGAVLQWCGK